MSGRVYRGPKAGPPAAPEPPAAWRGAQRRKGVPALGPASWPPGGRCAGQEGPWAWGPTSGPFSADKPIWEPCTSPQRVSPTLAHCTPPLAPANAPCVSRTRHTRTGSSLPAPAGSGRAFAAAVPTASSCRTRYKPRLPRKVELPPTGGGRREMQTTSNQLGAETLKSHPEIAARVEAVCPDEGRLLKRGAAAGVGGSPDLRRHAPPGPGSEGAADRTLRLDVHGAGRAEQSWGGKPSAVL